MKHEHSDMAEVLTRVGAVIVAWVGSITLGDVQALVGIVSGLAVLVYTVFNTYVLYRDKVKRRR